MSPNLAEIRDHLERRRRELANRRERVNRDLGRAEGPLSQDFSEQAVELQNVDTLGEIGRTTIDEIAAIDEALARLAAGQYGVCKHCGQEIDARRLEARPEAVTCARCTG
jgi:DnaK suppressor protein